MTLALEFSGQTICNNSSLILRQSFELVSGRTAVLMSTMGTLLWPCTLFEKLWPWSGLNYIKFLICLDIWKFKYILLTENYRYLKFQLKKTLVSWAKADYAHKSFAMNDTIKIYLPTFPASAPFRLSHTVSTVTQAPVEGFNLEWHQIPCGSNRNKGFDPTA